MDRFKGQPARKSLAAWSLLTVGALTLCACGSGGAGGQDAQEVPQDLVIGASLDVSNLNPWTATDFQSVEVLRILYSTLTELDEELNVVPGLAEDWTTSDDGLTVTFTLREDVSFADGSEFDAEDVVASYTAIQDEDTAAVAAANLASVDEIEATGTHEVTMTLNRPDAALFSKLALVNTAVLPADADMEEIGSTPNGTGPFTLESRAPNESLTLEANTDYWGGEPTLDTVEYRVIPDEQAIVSALQAGSIHMATFDDPVVADTIGGAVELLETPQLSYQAVQINGRSEPLDDVNVRLALSCIIDRDEVLESAAMGAGEITGPITAPNYLSDPQARPCPEPDPEQAQEYLDEAGYADGLTLSMIVMADGYPSTAVAQAENIQSQVEEIGVTLEIESLESGNYVDRWNTADFELALALNGGQPDPDVMYGRYFTSDGNLNEVAGYSSDTLDDLFDEGLAETEEDLRVDIYDELAAELEDEAVWVWLFAPYEYTALAEGVSGFTPMANGSMQSLTETTIE